MCTERHLRADRTRPGRTREGLCKAGCEALGSDTHADGIPFDWEFGAPINGFQNEQLFSLIDTDGSVDAVWINASDLDRDGRWDVVVPVPEPTAALLGSAALLTVGVIRRMRREGL
jgi:hypothetical protein